MNQGARLDQVVAAVRIPDDLLERPYLRPIYDDPQFVIRNVWRRYGGWYELDPAGLKPARAIELAKEIASLAGEPRCWPVARGSGLQRASSGLPVISPSSRPPPLPTIRRWAPRARR